MELFNINHRKTQVQKNAENKKYYRDILDAMNTYSGNSDFRFNTDLLNENNYQSLRDRMKVNYDLYNNIINVNEFNYICKPFGEGEQGELPANMVNRDIISGKIKAVESMEITEPFDFSVVAVNEDATTRKEVVERDKIREYVVQFIMMPIKAELEAQYQAELKGKEVSPEEMQQIQQQLQQEIENKTPAEVKKYMQREHKDPAELLAVHLLNYLQFKEDFKRKTNKGWKHACLSAHEVYYIGHDADLQPSLKCVNSLDINYDTNEEIDFIEDREWFSVTYSMTTNQLIKLLGDELTEKEIDKLYEESTETHFNQESTTGRVHQHIVLHGVWVSLRKIGFLSYVDENGELQETIVPEDYKLNVEWGELDIEWKWIPEVHEGFKIGKELYKRCQPVLGQIIDMDNLYSHKLPYCGVIYDNLNSEPTSLIDRMKYYQYYYNIIMYRIEMLMASDKGKILMMNINTIPKTAGISLEKFLYYAEALKIGFYNPTEEGNKGGEVSAGNIAKEIDMSLASDIQKYIGLAEYIERRCGESVGINKNIEGQTPANQSVGNAQMNYQQAAGILQTYYDLHNIVKKNLLTILLEKAKVLYSLNPKQRKLQYILDDMTLHMFDVDVELLDNSVYGLFLSNNVNSKVAKQAVQQLAHAAMQNDKANLADISRVMRATSIQEAEELLEMAEISAHERAMDLEKARDEAMTKDRQDKIAWEREKMQFERDTMELQERLKTERELQKQAIMTIGFNTDKDMDKDGQLDALEVLKKGVEADIKIRKQDLDEKKFEHQKEVDAQQIAIQRKKAIRDNNKS